MNAIFFQIWKTSFLWLRYYLQKKLERKRAHFILFFHLIFSDAFASPFYIMAGVSEASSGNDGNNKSNKNKKGKKAKSNSEEESATSPTGSGSGVSIVSRGKKPFT